ncbi:MAG: hypothetical protein LBM63_05910 [Rikenellaceae bacterium]|jgi:hypothetical protein|nr:hypothetical protein [Rikenellaceae bacterium]
MKKILLLIVFAVVATTTLSAQQKSTYQGDVEFEYSIMTNYFPFQKIGIHTTHGIRFNEHFFAGVGTGIETMTPYFFISIPAYLSVTGYIPVTPRVNLFTGIDLGTSIMIDWGGDPVTIWGVLVRPEIGVAFKNKRDRIRTLALGYSYESWPTPIEDSISAISLKFGLRF